MNISNYLDSWAIYHIDCSLRVKDRAKLNNDCWRKLRQYHLEQYVNTLEAPFGFMFDLRYKHRNVYKQISCANEIYRLVLKKREAQFREKRYVK